jgi:hypothetical protein
MFFRPSSLRAEHWECYQVFRTIGLWRVPITSVTFCPEDERREDNLLATPPGVASFSLAGLTAL